MRLWLKRHRFLLRTFLILVLVFLIGFLAAGFIISYTTAGDYVDAQSNYEYEKMSGDADKLNEKLININAAILQAYQRDEDRENIATILGEEDSETKEQKIKEFIIQAVQISPYITDIILLDTQEQQTYMQSNILSQVWDTSYDWFADDFVQEVSESTNEVKFFENHKMSGINLNREVCTFGHKIINPMGGNRNAMMGIILIQVPTKTLFEPVGGYEGRQEGKSFIVDKENHVLYTSESDISDKQAVEIYKQYGQEDTSAFERYLLRSKKLISWSGFTYVNIMDKVGIQDSHYFTRMFKKYKGMTPTEYRNNRGSVL